MDDIFFLPLVYSLHMRYPILVLGFTMIVLVFIAGCSSIQPATSTVTLTTGTPTPCLPTPTSTLTAGGLT